MAEAAIAKVTEEAVVGCINQIKHHFNYLSQYHDNMENLNTKLQNLESKRAEIQDKVSNATDKGQTILAEVQKWLREVDGKKEEVEEIIKGEARVGNGCWKGWVVNVNQRYSLSKKAIKKCGDLDMFLAGGVFEIVAHSIRPLAHVFDPVGASSSEKMKKDIDHQILEVQGNEESKEGTTSNLSAAGADGGLTSRSVLLNNVMAAVRDPNIRIIRLCGMGGIGKTTVAKQVEQRARAEHLFHEIAMTEVNQNPDPKIIQLHIAELLGLELKEDSISARAKRLCERLNAKDQNGQSKKILLILDNVWKKEDLEQVGVPLTEEKSLCKILLTSRSDLVCKDIAPELEFNIGVLPYPENLNLFRQCIPTKSFYDQKMAEDLVKKCGGLPISITAIAGAVKYGEKEIWADALTKLRKSEFTGEYAQVLNSLKVSYDFLANEEIKSFFRLFCFFRKGSDVPIEDLVRYGMALGFFTNPENLDEARNEAHVYADKLLHSNLLLRGDKEWCFKVHDIVWDFSAQAPSNDLFIINHGDALIKPRRTKSNQNYTSISLQCSEMVKVLEGVDFRNLKFLQLIGNSDTLPLKFPNNSFEEMIELNVLAFRSLEVKPLPESLQRLNNLLSLSFDRCSIGGDISMIGNLVKLELLSFAYSDIQKLPLQIANLKALRLLDMTGCSELLVIPPDVLSKLSSLEELYMRGTPLELRSGNPTLFSEIASMSKLVVIDIVMPVEVLPMDVLFAKLKHFKISVTESVRDEEDGYLLENYLELECYSSVLQQRGVKLLLQDTVRMDLNIPDLKYLFPLNDSEVENFSKLKNLSIKRCNEMVYLVNMMGHLDQNNVFQNLVSLRLYNLPGLVDIFHVSDSSQSFVAPFCNLKVLNVEGCDELEHLLSSSNARSLNSLEVIKVKHCNKLKVVFRKGRHGEVKVELGNLKKMTLKDLPDLVGFCSDVEAPEFPQLEKLKIWRLPMITSIIHPEIGHFDSSHRDDSSSHPLFSYKGVDTARKFQKLGSLKVYSCHSLRHLLTTSIAISFRELQYLKVSWCESLTTLIAEEGIKEENSATEEVMLFPRLKVLDLYHLESLSISMPKGYTLTWSSLKELKLGKCGGEWNKLSPTPNKSNIQGASNKFALSSLEELNLANMSISSEFWYDYFPRGFSYELREFNAKSLKLSIIMFSPDMIRKFQHLTTISVNNCESMEVLFDLEEECTVGEVESKLATLNKLDSLEIWHLPKMVNVWKKVPHNFQGFGNLTILEVNGCESLMYLFVPSIAKCLVKLKEMKIIDCEMMEEVVSMRDEEGQLSDDIILFPQLEDLVLAYLPSLKYLEAPNVVEAHDDVNATITSTSNIISNQESIDCTSPALVTLEGNVCPWPWSFHKLKYVFLNGCNNLLYIFPPNRVVRLPLLEDISVKYCENLQYIFSSSMATSLEQLKTIEVEGCNDLLSIFPSNGIVRLPALEKISVKACKSLQQQYIFSSSTATSLEQLKTIEVEGCNDLLSIFPSNGIVRLPALEKISVKACKSLQYIFSSLTAKSLEQLTELRIEGCKMMTEVIREDEEEVDGRIKVVFHSLTKITLDNLPNLQGICLGMVYFDWPLLRSVNIINCLKMRIFTSGYSTTQVLEDLSVNGESYKPMMEEGDVNTVLRNAQIKAEYLGLRRKGTLTITGFHLAGEHLIAPYSSWSWESSCVDDDIAEQYLIARNVPCLTKPRKSTSKVMETDDFNKNEVDDDDNDDDDDDDDEDEDDDDDDDDATDDDNDDDDDEDGMNIYKPRTYDVSITYDHIYKCTRLWLKGYDESKMDLPLDLVFEDINLEYLEESDVTIEDHPYESGPHVSLTPSRESCWIAKLLFRDLLENGFEPNVQNHLQLFADVLFPTIQFGAAR